ncbi:malectin domain-containing carbohydrate-binding protein [Kineococcus esterisolvens]|uniref:malectin domain-containing carbohydrate-binding protein n=2 Tax=Kineococcus TaxID=33981 RepID=UPI003D7D06C3
MRFSRAIATAVATAALAGSAAVCVPASAATPSTVAINAGGSAISASGTSYSADKGNIGGRTSTTTVASGTTDSALYQSVRYGMSGYSIPVTNGTYDVTLKMVENYWSAAGKRVFDVSAEGSAALSDLDPFQIAGGKNKAAQRTFTTTVKDGKLDLAFKADQDNASIAAILITPKTTATPAPAPAPAVGINAGGSAISASGTSYSADKGNIGGRTSTTTVASGTTDSALYQSVRYGMSGYSIPVTNGTYDVTLKMVENYWSAAGKRVFDVSAEGSAALSDLDPFQIAGGKNKAAQRTFTTTVKDGKLDLAFKADQDNASIAAILIAPRTGTAPTPVVTQTPQPTTPAPAPTPTTTPTSGTTTADRASWKAPTLQNPLVWVPSASQRYFKAPADRDVLIQWPSTALDVQGGFELTGGRNVVSIGGTVKFSKRYFPSMVDQPNNNRCLKINGNDKLGAPRTVHVEDFHCAGSHIWEGINVDSKAERAVLTVQFRDIRVDGVHVEYPGSTGKHIGGDALQVWNGPHRLFIDGFTAKNLEYQGFFLQPYQFGTGKLGTWDIRNVNLEGAASRSAYILWLAGTRNASDSNGVQINVKNVYVQPGGGRTRASSLWEADKDWYDVTIGKPARDFVS